MLFNFFVAYVNTPGPSTKNGAENILFNGIYAAPHALGAVHAMSSVASCHPFYLNTVSKWMNRCQICKIGPCISANRFTRFLNRCLLHVVNSLLLTAKSATLLGICRLRLGFPHEYDNVHLNCIQLAIYETPSPTDSSPPPSDLDPGLLS
jgi:hypothetical protein